MAGADHAVEGGLAQACIGRTIGALAEKRARRIAQPCPATAAAAVNADEKVLRHCLHSLPVFACAAIAQAAASGRGGSVVASGGATRTMG